MSATHRTTDAPATTPWLGSAMIAVVPTVLPFFLMRRYFMQGPTTGSDRQRQRGASEAR